MTVEKNKKIILWTLTFILASVLVSFSNFQSSSNDSQYYSTLVKRYYTKSWPDILTAKWGENFWGFGPETYMRDQLPGQLALGVTLAKAGVPAAHALHILEMFFLLGAILICARIAASLESSFSDLLPAALILLPLTFSYTVRANHEAGLFFFSALSLYAGLQLSRSKSWILAEVVSCLALMWIKGPFVLFGFLLFTWGFLISEKNRSSYFSWLLTVILSGALVVVSGLLYEKTFQAWTGEPFFSVFWNIQIEQRALNKATHPWPLQKTLNASYYLGNYLGYALPWTLIALLSLIKVDRSRLKHFVTGKLSLLFLGGALIYLGVFSMSERTAGRYTFSGYYFFAAWVILLCLTVMDWPLKVQKKLAGLKAHYLAAFLWILAVSVHLVKK